MVAWLLSLGELKLVFLQNAAQNSYNRMGVRENTPAFATVLAASHLLDPLGIYIYMCFYVCIQMD